MIPEVDEQGRYQIRDLFKFVQRGKDGDGKIIGEHIAVGNLPTFMDEIEVNRIPFTRDKFQPPSWYQELVARK